eukprot:TRINITY_DN966_c2_g1_i3.p1 TRINITY_DN966_c2_g1~~TRINITY_DN966_c2_g1_i3.p1  ORF type:complete len:1615 (-),score=259.52 TRINITY_DN966_c2_g1_i3:227-5071(-)
MLFLQPDGAQRAMFVVGVVLLALLLHLSPNGGAVDAALCDPGLNFNAGSFKDFEDAWNIIRLDPRNGTCEGSITFADNDEEIIPYAQLLPTSFCTHISVAGGGRRKWDLGSVYGLNLWFDFVNSIATHTQECSISNIDFHNKTVDILSNMAEEQVPVIFMEHSGKKVGANATFHDATLNVTDCTFSDISVTYTKGIYSFWDTVISMREVSSLHVKDSTFENIFTSSEYAKGAIGIENGDHTIINSTFINCQTGDHIVYGGAISSIVYRNVEKSTYSSMVIRDSHFEGCNSTYGGAVATKEFLSVLIEDTVFLGNSASARGGAVCLSDSNTITLRRTTFFDNKAIMSGGAFCALCNDCQNKGQTRLGPMTVTIEDSIFENSFVGGADQIENLEGGAAHFEEVHNVHISGTHFENNSIVPYSDSGSFATGGAVCVECISCQEPAVGTTTIDNCTFVRNSIQDTFTIGHSPAGGTIAVFGKYAADNYLYVKNSTFDHNFIVVASSYSAVGGVVGTNVNMKVSDTTFQNTRCHVVYALGCNVGSYYTGQLSPEFPTGPTSRFTDFERVVMQNTQIDEYDPATTSGYIEGGFIFSVMTVNANITDCWFDQIVSIKSVGNVLFSIQGLLCITRTTISNNAIVEPTILGTDMSLTAGALYVGCVQLIMESCTFANNRVGRANSKESDLDHGAAIYFSSLSGTGSSISRSTFVNNTSGDMKHGEVFSIRDGTSTSIAIEAVIIANTNPQALVKYVSEGITLTTKFGGNMYDHINETMAFNYGGPNLVGPPALFTKVEGLASLLEPLAFAPKLFPTDPVAVAPVCNADALPYVYNGSVGIPAIPDRWPDSDQTRSPYSECNDNMCSIVGRVGGSVQIRVISTPSPSPSLSPSPSPSPTPLPTSSSTPHPTHTPTPSSSPSPNPSATPTPVPTVSTTPAPSLTSTPVPSATPTALPSSSPTTTPHPCSGGNAIHNLANLETMNSTAGVQDIFVLIPPNNGGFAATIRGYSTNTSMVCHDIVDFRLFTNTRWRDLEYDHQDWGMRVSFDFDSANKRRNLQTIQAVGEINFLGLQSVQSASFIFAAEVTPTPAPPTPLPTSVPTTSPTPAPDCVPTAVISVSPASGGDVLTQFQVTTGSVTCASKVLCYNVRYTLNDLPFDVLDSCSTSNDVIDTYLPKGNVKVYGVLTLLDGVTTVKTSTVNVEVKQGGATTDDLINLAQNSGDPDVVLQISNTIILGIDGDSDNIEDTVTDVLNLVGDSFDGNQDQTVELLSNLLNVDAIQPFLSDEDNNILNEVLSVLDLVVSDAIENGFDGGVPQETIDILSTVSVVVAGIDGPPTEEFTEQFNDVLGLVKEAGVKTLTCGESSVITSSNIDLELSKEEVKGGTELKSGDVTFDLPSSVTDKYSSNGCLAQSLVTIKDYPFECGPKCNDCLPLISDVTGLTLHDKDGREENVKDLKDPICFEIPFSEEFSTEVRSSEISGSGSESDDSGGTACGDEKKDKPKKKKPKCQYFDRDTGCMSSKGCEVDKVKDNAIVCCCTHLTDYGVVFGTQGGGGGGSGVCSSTDGIDMPIFISSWVAFGVCILVIIVICVVYDLRKRAKTKEAWGKIDQKMSSHASAQRTSA